MSTLAAATANSQKNAVLRDDLNNKYKEVFAMTAAMIKNKKQSRSINPKEIEECNRKFNIIKSIFDQIKANMSNINPPQEKGRKFEISTGMEFNVLDKMISELSDTPASQNDRTPNFHKSEKKLHRTKSERELPKSERELPKSESERKISHTKSEKSPPHPSKFPLIFLTDSSGHPLEEYNGLLVDMQLIYTVLYQNFLLISNQQSKVEKSDIEFVINKMKTIRNTFVTIRKYDPEKVQKKQLQTRREMEVEVELFISSIEKAFIELYDRYSQENDSLDQMFGHTWLF